MREVLFRGKGTCDCGLNAGNWIYGYYVNDFWKRNDCGIIPSDHEKGRYCEVCPETVGQYTGLTDKNGKKIFEGDILRYFVWGSYECFAVVRIGEYEQDGSGDEYPAIKVCGVYAEVKRKCPLIKADEDYFPEYLKKSSLLEIGIENFELVGNITDNPELLKGGAE